MSAEKLAIENMTVSLYKSPISFIIVSAIENRQGFKIACLEEIAFNNKWIDKKQLIRAVNFYGNCSYSDYIKKLI